MNTKAIKAAGEKLKQQFPEIAHGVSAKHGGSIAVRVETQEQADKLPKTSDGFKLDVRVTGHIKAL